MAIFYNEKDIDDQNGEREILVNTNTFGQIILSFTTDDDFQYLTLSPIEASELCVKIHNAVGKNIQEVEDIRNKR